MRSTFERLLIALSWCYPPAFRRAHGPEMRQFVRTSLSRGVPAGSTLLRDVLLGAIREWTAALPFPRQPFHNAARDVRHGIRMLLRTPAFTAASIATLALGIGANSAMFTLADATLLRPLPIRDPGRLAVWSWSSSYPDYLEYARRTDVFDGVAAVAGGGRVNVVAAGIADITPVVFLSGNALDLFGVGAATGRVLLPADDVRNGPLVGVLGYDYWRSRFGEDPAVVGRTLRINGRPLRVVGVLQKGFRGVSLGSNPSLYIPVALSGEVRTGFFARPDALNSRGLVWISVIGRLRPEVSLEQATTAMDALYRQFHPAKPGQRVEKLRLQPLPTKTLGRSSDDVRRFVVILLAVVGLTLLIGCANLANLLLARGSRRRSEIGLRLALGATRGRIIRLLLAEALLLSIAGGLAGLAVAAVTLQFLKSFQLPGGIAIEHLRVELNVAALFVTFALSLATGVIFGALPAWRAARTDVLVSLRSESRHTAGGGRLRAVFLTAQVALSLMLLAGTGLFARSLLAALQTPMGLDPAGLVTASVNVGLARYNEGRAAAYYADALERLRALPEVESIAWAGMIPTRNSWVNQTTIDGYTPPDGEVPRVSMSHVGPEYFRTIGTRIVEGREFTARDHARAPLVAVVNEAAARTYWAGRRALAGRLKFGDDWYTVVGVVETTIASAVRENPEPFVYLAFNQALSGRESIATDPAHLFVRARGEVDSVMAALRAQLQALDPEMPLYDVQPFEERVRALLMTQRMGLTLFALFSALALALATVGIYGVASYVASTRTREIGVRIALGASRRSVRRLMIRFGAVPIITGLLLGLAVALYASRVVGAFLIEVEPTDPVTFAAVTMFLALVALTASYLPARRAARVDPVMALRTE